MFICEICGKGTLYSNELSNGNCGGCLKEVGKSPIVETSTIHLQMEKEICKNEGGEVFIEHSLLIEKEINKR